MRVVHLGKYYPPHRGGIEAVTEALCRGLSARGVEVTVVVSNEGDAWSDERQDGVRVLRLPKQGEFRSQPLNRDLRALLTSLEYDVLHVHTPNPLGALAAVRASGGRPLIATHHSDVVRQKVLGVAANALHRMLYRRASAVVTATPCHIQYSNVLGSVRDRCRVIPFALAHPVSEHGPAWDVALPTSWRNEPLALFVGRLVYYKGLEVLLRALARTERLNLAVVGTGPLDPKLRRLRHSLRLEDRARFLGNLDESRLHALYRASRFLVLPSTSAAEAFGMVQLEAMSAGKPVISTNLRSGVPYVNQHERTGLIVPPGCELALAEAMARLGKDDALAAKLGSQARRRCSVDFAPERVFEQWLHLYAGVIRLASGPPGP